MENKRPTPDRGFKKASAKMARKLREALGLGPDEELDTLVVLGTGWGALVELEVSCDLRKTFKIFRAVRKKKGHALRAGIATVGGKRVFVLDGRVHLNDVTFAKRRDKVYRAMRYQFEMFAHLGVKNLLTTCGAGGLDDDSAPAGAVVVVEQIHRAPGMETPFTEHCSASAVICPDHLGTLTMPARDALQDIDGLTVATGIYALERGTDVESLFTKRLRASQGCLSIGMSLLVSLGIAHLYGWQAIALAFHTNGMEEVLDHGDNVAAGEAQAHNLNICLQRCLALFSRS